MPRIIHISNIYKVLGEEGVNEIQAWLDQVYDHRKEMDNLRTELQTIRDELQFIRRLLTAR